MAPLNKRRVPPTELREKYNNGDFEERLQKGELPCAITRNSHPAPPLSGEPLCTRSQILTYFDAQGNKVAVLHQYLRTDGTIGGRGRKPDPKKLLIGDTVYYV